MVKVTAFEANARMLHLRKLAIVLAITVLAQAQTNDNWISPAKRAELVERVRAALPLGWSITVTTVDSTPEDWNTLDRRGFSIEGKNSGGTFKSWFLPKDWIGIRKVDPQRRRIVYWEGILADNDFKLITNSDDVQLHEALQTRLRMQTPSLTNGGAGPALALFKDRSAAVNAETQGLVRQFCTTPECRSEAAYSLVVSGVPATALIVECAARANGKTQDFCASALGYLQGPDSLRVLNTLVSRPGDVQRYAAFSLAQIADPSSGPPLLQGLRVASSPDAADAVVGTLERIRYQPAAPEILARMLREGRNACRAYPKALATLRYVEAVSAIQQLCNTAVPTAEWIHSTRQYLGWLPEIAILRLTASWGTATDGVRLLLLTPDEKAGSARTVVMLENVSSQNLQLLIEPGALVIDGKSHPVGPSVFDGNATLPVNDVYARRIDLTPFINDGAPHRVEYRLGAAVSNSRTVRIP